ncbi:polysaccharide biosynthesis/export family protein [Coralliovum pocilloporae]|uniref:polysaccharide biosynthesis/export family protein n=1 Tax=Coralliovum pocilloporae TaxID=3066369 RepID=UPI00330786F0
MFIRSIAIALVLALAACSSTAPRNPSLTQGLKGPYRLDSGDQLRILVFGQRELTNSYTVDQSGFLSFPLVGAIPARGRTTADMEKAIAKKLKNGFLRNPDVTVEVQTFRPFFIRGAVRAPGQFPYVNGMTVENAIAIAGGFTERAAKKSVFITRHINGKVINGRLALTDPIRPGDTIRIDERLF